MERKHLAWLGVAFFAAAGAAYMMQDKITLGVVWILCAMAWGWNAYCEDYKKSGFLGSWSMPFMAAAIVLGVIGIPLIILERNVGFGLGILGMMSTLIAYHGQDILNWWWKRRSNGDPIRKGDKEENEKEH